MAVPLFKAYNGSIFIKKGHADQLKLVSNAHSSKKVGKRDADGKSKAYNVVDIGIVLPPCLKRMVASETRPPSAFAAASFFPWGGAVRGRAPKYLKEEDALPIVVLGKRDEAAEVFAWQRWLLLPFGPIATIVETVVQQGAANSAADVPDVLASTMDSETVESIAHLATTVLDAPASAQNNEMQTVQVYLNLQKCFPVCRNVGECCPKTMEVRI